MTHVHPIVTPFLPTLACVYLLLNVPTAQSTPDETTTTELTDRIINGTDAGITRPATSARYKTAAVSRFPSRPPSAPTAMPCPMSGALRFSAIDQ